MTAEQPDLVVARADRLASGPRTAADPDAVRAASALRALNTWIVTEGAAGSEFGPLADALEALAARATPADPRASRYAPGALHLDGGLQPNERLTHPIVGVANPSAPPMRLEGAAGRAIGHLTFSAAQEGFPGCTHGGWIAAVFDMLLGTASAGARAEGGFTGTLSVRYVRLTPIGVPLRWEAWAEGAEGRKTFVRATMQRTDRDGPDALCAEAEAVFVGPREREAPRG